MGTDTLEDRAVELLGQIQASVGESVRAMNELGALRRREADEAHRQHDDALKKLDLIGQRAEQFVTKNEALVGEIREGWGARIGAVAIEVAAEQARQCSAATVDVIAERAQALIAVGATVVLLPLSVWWASGLITAAAEQQARAEVASSRRLRELSAVDFRDCEVNGTKRLCVRVEQGLPVAAGQEGAVYAVVGRRKEV